MQKGGEDISTWYESIDSMEVNHRHKPQQQKCKIQKIQNNAHKKKPLIIFWKDKCFSLGKTSSLLGKEFVKLCWKMTQKHFSWFYIKKMFSLMGKTKQKKVCKF